MNEMISSMRFNNMNSFHERFRSADALLVDDIQTLQGKTGRKKSFSTPSTLCTTCRNKSSSLAIALRNLSPDSSTDCVLALSGA